ncbi:MAG: nuclear transport factor 2 family protein [Acidimicrobiia bacterium]
MAEHPNVAVMRRAYDAFAKGDTATLSDLIAEDVAWHVGGHNILTGEYKGREAVFGFFGRLAEETGGTFKLGIHALMADDEHGVALVENSATRGDKTIEARFAHIAHIRGGQLTEFWAFPEDRRAIDEFWS